MSRSDDERHRGGTRRQVLKALGVIGVGGLAGCSGDGGSTPTPTPTATDTPSPTSTPTPTPIPAPDEGLVGYFPLDGQAGNQVTGTDAEVIGDPDTEAAGVRDGAFGFTIDEADTIADAIVTEDLAVNGSQVTVGAWVNYTAHEPWARVYQAGGAIDDVPASGGWDVEFDGTNDTARVVTWSDGINQMDETAQTLPTETWLFVVTVIDGEDIRLHVFDETGEREDSPTSASAPRAQREAAPLILMAGDGHDTAGRMDEVRAYSRALSTEEVARLYRASGGGT